VESEKIFEIGKDFSHSKASSVEEADLVLINSCAVTERAVKKLCGLIKNLKKKNPICKIAVTGCAVDYDNKKIKLAGADYVVSNFSKLDIFDSINADEDSVIPIDQKEFFQEAKAADKEKHTRAFLKIQDGCDAFCSYCIIPFLRGEPVSMEQDKCINEMKELIKDGYKEIVPVGIHVGKFGQDTESKSSLYTLMKAASDIEGEFRIRMTSIETNELTGELIDLVKSTDKICSHFHIPLQSGSTDILKKMNRRYTADEYILNAKKIKQKIPNATIGADVIVGFPGETEEHFNETVSTIKDSDIDFLHVFQYSDRPGTKASNMPDKISGVVKAERARILRALGDELKIRALERQVGLKHRVLAEKDNKGFTDNYFTVKLNLSAKRNEFVNVKIRGVNEDGSLSGDII